MSSNGFFEEASYEDPGPRRREEDDPFEIVPTQPVGPSGVDLPQLSRLARELGPRDMDDVLKRAREVGAALGRILPSDPKQEGTGAYYRWSVKNKDGTRSIIEGPTIGLMDSLVELWGRLVYQLELVSESPRRVLLRARVVDLMSLVIHERPYPANLKPPPGRFANNIDEAERWRVMQLQSAESKAIRTVLERVIPQSVIEAALEAAKEAAAGAQLGTTDVIGDDGKPIIDPKTNRPKQRRRSLTEAVDAAVKGLGGLKPPPDLAMVERWLGRPRKEWVANDLSALRGLYGRWSRGELTPESFAVEVAEAEASRAGDEDAPTNGHTPTDRLDNLGLGKETTGAPSGAGGSGPVQGAGGGAPSPASSTPATEARPRPTVAEDLDALLEGLHRAGGPITIEQAKERFKSEYKPRIQRLMPARWDPIVALGIETGRLVVEGDRMRLALGPTVNQPPGAAPQMQDQLPPEAGEPDSVDKMSVEDLELECRSLVADLGEAADPAFEKAGIRVVDGSPPEKLRVLLRELVKLVPGGES